MKVETFEVEEVIQEAQTMAADSEAIEIGTRLGLKGQATLANPETVTRLPYRKMTAEERGVYGALCPQRVPLADYSESIIPLRVLQVAAHATEIGMFERLEVWAAPSVTVKDPVLVGLRKNVGPNSWQGPEPFILARWGQELLPFDKLIPMARQRMRESYKAALEALRDELDGALTRVNRRVEEALSGEKSIPDPKLYAD